MKALDLFCGAGGASMGLHRAGFDVTGVDLAPQPRYPFRFIQADALTVDLDGYDFIWASPPCQHYSMYSRNLGVAKRHPNLIAAVRDRLMGSDAAATVIENVVGAPLHQPIMLCGTMFGLPLLRHRLFETRPILATLVPPCHHRGGEVPVYGHGTPQWHRERLGRNIHVAEQREAMGIDWMTREALTQAIPPAYSEFLARQFLRSQGAQYQHANERG